MPSFTNVTGSRKLQNETQDFAGGNPKCYGKPIKRKIWDPTNRKYNTGKIQRKFPR